MLAEAFSEAPSTAGPPSCDLRLGRTPTAPPSVAVDCELVEPLGTTWTWDGDDTVTLQGDLCQRVLAGEATVRVLSDCAY